MKLHARLPLLALIALPLTLSAATISGTVTDRTTNKPAAGDRAVLLDLSQGMQPVASTTVNAQGQYSFTVANTTGMHLVRVEHEKADYYGPVPPNTTTVNIDVYDVAAKVPGVHVYADVTRVQTDSQGLNVTENYFVRNHSKPARTQYSDRAFEFSLPKGAVIQGTGATGPGGMEVTVPAVPLKEKDHYAFAFPLRPGETEFQVAYEVPYSGSFIFHPQVSMPTDNVAVMLPKSMTFSGATFQPLHGAANEPGTQTYLTTNVNPGTKIAYTISGSGSLPREDQNAQNGGGQGAQGGAAQATPANGPPGIGLEPPIDTPGPLTKYKWWILSTVGLAMVVAAGFLLRTKPGMQTAAGGGAPSPGRMPSALTSTLPPGVKATALRAELAASGTYLPPAGKSAATTTAAQTSVPMPGGAERAATGNPMLAALKEELFALETERLEGKLSDEEYAKLKSALEVVMRRALMREPVKA